MNYGVVVAGGIGTRMGSDKPKQFLTIGDKPVIVHTVEKFVICNDFAKVIVLVPADWIEYTRDIMKKYLGENMMNRIALVQGGATRNETIMNAIAHIESEYGLDEETIIVTHDAVRPFVTSRIIRENIEMAGKFGATDTVFPATDTIVESQDGEVISQIPNRATLFQGQTPQSFNAKKLKALYEGLTDEEKDILTDACKIFAMKGEKVYLVEGEVSNMKITYPFDLKVAATMLGGDFDA